jgi:hypothetical protein
MARRLSREAMVNFAEDSFNTGSFVIRNGAAGFIQTARGKFYHA